jgi:hypothetical protein
MIKLKPLKSPRGDGMTVAVEFSDSIYGASPGYLLGGPNGVHSLPR